MLSKLNENGQWRALYGKKSARLKDLELVLRFLALHFHASSYGRPMKDFLNRYMAANRALQSHSEGQIRGLFESTVQAIHDCIGPRAFRLKNAVNAALLDSIMVGVASRLRAGPIKRPDLLKAAYATLLTDTDYLGSIGRATADEESVKTRLRTATEAFAKIE